MNFLFIIANNQGHFFSKQRDWIDGKHASNIYRAKHFDEALNTLLELNTKDVSMRAQVLKAEINKRGEPMIIISDIFCPAGNETSLGSDYKVQSENDDNSTV
tara:strand:+ start:807 stop:1112 length:306 start_codon:yes stop_codon:yes gene_type:complete